MTNQTNQYRIQVKETFESRIADWPCDLTILPQENGTTVLLGSFQDQPALRGFLEQLWNLNISVISVERIENES